MISRDVVPRTIESTRGGIKGKGKKKRKRCPVALTVDNQYVFACEFERHGVQLPSHVFLSANSQKHEKRVIGKNCADTYRISCSGMIKVRPMYRFFTNPSRYGRPRACARFNAATREVSGTGMTTSTVMFFSVSTRWTSFASALPIAIRLRYTLIPSRTESGRARYTYSNMSGAKVAAGTTWRRDTPERVSITASPGWRFLSLSV